MSRKIVCESEKHSQNSLSLREEILPMLLSHPPGVTKSKACIEPNTRIWKTFLTFAEIHEKWQTQEDKQEAVEDEDNKLTHSSGSNQLDPLLIERGQADAVRLVRSTVNPTPGTAMVHEPTNMNATDASGVPPMVFVDDEGSGGAVSYRR